MQTITIDGQAFVRLADLARERGKAPAVARMAAQRGQLTGVVSVGRDLYVPLAEAERWHPGDKPGRPRKDKATE